VALSVLVGELLGYARVSTTVQDPALQHDALRGAGCWRTWTDTASGSKTDRPQLGEVMAALRPGDTLAVWRLDRLGRSLPHLIDTVRVLQERGVGFRSLQESIDTTTPGGRLVFHIFGSLAEFSVISTRRAGPWAQGWAADGDDAGEGEAGPQDD